VTFLTGRESFLLILLIFLNILQLQKSDEVYVAGDFQEVGQEGVEERGSQGRGST